jgi:hypothetical protein
MITSAQVLAQIEQHLNVAKQEATNNGNVRDELIAIKTLCEMLIVNGGATQVTNAYTQTVRQQAPVIQANKIEEDDANGASIFDF